MGSRSNERGTERASGMLEKLKLRFRRQLIRGASPKIDDYLREVPKALEMELFGILLELEVRFRQQKGGRPTADEYHRRYPRFSKSIRVVFFESTVESDFGNEAGAKDDGEGTTILEPTAGPQQLAQLGDFSIVRPIGHGAMGEVYEARNLKTGNSVALKKLPPLRPGHSGDSRLLARFRKEFRSLCEVNHRNLVGMQTLEVDGEQWFLTMDLIEGVDFLSYVRPAGKLDEMRLRSCLQQLAKGILELHRSGKLHRDLKPSNVIVKPDGHLVILDFGLVAEIQSERHQAQTSSAIFSGTPPYAAPEQLGNFKTEANDWYGLGTMLYEALVGEVPFPPHGVDAYQLMLRKQQEDPPKLTARSDLPADLCELADGLIQRDVQKRFGAEAVVEHLKLSEMTAGGDSTRRTDMESGLGKEDFLVEFGSQDEVVLVGREQQLLQLDSIMDEFLQTRQPTMVWVTGLSGEGKSSLTHKFLQSARLQEEMLVLYGRCYDRESVPFKAIDALVDSLLAKLRKVGPERLSGYISPRTHLLLNIFPVLRQIPYLSSAGQPEVLGLDNRQIQLLAFDALLDLWAGLGQQQPMVIFIDDLQWGDADSAEMLGEMLSGDLKLPVLILGSLRSDEVGQSSFYKKWQQMEASGRLSIPCHEVKVGPLTQLQQLSLLKSWCENGGIDLGDDAEKLARESEGNPLLLELLFDSYRVREPRSQNSGISELISIRLDRLPQEANRMLNAVAVAGHACQLDELAAAAASAESPDALLSHMRSEKLIRWIGPKDELKVDTYHDKVRETILGQVDIVERQAIHLRFAEYIQKSILLLDESQTSDAAASHPRLFDLAYHFFEAKDPRAFQYQLLAGHRALSAFAIEESLGHFSNALECMDDSVNQETHYSLMLGLAYATLLSGDCEGSRRMFEQARGLAQSPLEEARCLRGIAQGMLRSGKPGPATDYFRQTVRLLGDPEPRTLVGKLWQIMFSQFQLLAVPRISFLWRRREISERDLFLAELAGEFVMSMQTDFWAMAAYNLKHGVRAKFSPYLDSQIRGSATSLHFYAINGFARLSRRYLNWVKKNLESSQSQIIGTEAREMVGEGCYFLGELDLAEAELKQTTVKLKQFRSYYEGMAYHFLRHSASVRGRPALIDYWSQRELEYASRNGDAVTKAWAYYGIADGLARAGQTEEAVGLAKKSLDVLEDVESQTVMVAKQEIGRALLQASNYKQAQEVLSSSVAMMFRLLLFPEIWVDNLPLLTEAILGSTWMNQSLDLRQQQTASRMAFKSRLICNKFPTIKPHVMRVSGRAMAAKGRRKAAMNCFRKAQLAADKIGAHYEKARALIDQSVLGCPNAMEDRQAGLELLESLGCVLPDAELEYLGIDREAHYVRAREAREADAKNLQTTLD